MSELKACIFDLDGVIVDSARFHFLSWKRMAQNLSINLDEAFDEQLKGVSRLDSLEKILAKGDLHLDSDTKINLMNQKNAWYLEYIATMNEKDILPGSQEFLEEVKKAGIKIGLGSSSRNATKILEYVGLTHYFDAIVDGTHLTFSKPDPEVFLKGASMLGVHPEETIVFEDATSGVEAALAGGFRCVGIGSSSNLGKANIVVTSLEHFTLEEARNL